MYVILIYIQIAFTVFFFLSKRFIFKKTFKSLTNLKLLNGFMYIHIFQVLFCTIVLIMSF